MAKKTIATPPWCPFCGQKVGRASDAPERKMHEFPVGNCQCGAVYTCDATGHNVGAAIVETLVYACGGNAEFAWDLMPEDDYLTGRIENYDEQAHQVVAKKNLDGRAVRGVLYFIRLHTDISTIAKRTAQKTDTIATRTIPSEQEQNSFVVEHLLSGAIDYLRMHGVSEVCENAIRAALYHRRQTRFCQG